MAKQILGNEKPVRSLSEFEFIHDPNDKNSKLGVGSFASVKLAKETKTGKMHAIKIISMQPKKVTSSDLHNIKTEITVHRNLDHPNIIKFYDYIQKDDHIYFVLDYAENGNLYSYLHKRKGLPSEDVFKFFHQTCLAFQYLHQNDILHRDLKPENLLLDKNCNIKLCDFGWCARRINERRTTFCGTYEYMAPEVVHKKTYDYRVDIWSLGVLLYELIHKEAPYKGRSLDEITKSLTNPQIKFRESIHPEAKDLILKILKHNPEERLSIQQILEHPWVKYRQQKQKEAAFNKLQINEFRVSPREGKAANIEAIQCESPKIQMRKDKENVRADSATGGDKNPLTENMVSPSKKISNSQLFHSFNGTLPARDNSEKLKEREREKTKEQSSVHSNESNTMSQQYKGHRRRPLQEFVSNLHVKAMKENILNTTSRRHAKSSSSLTSDILEKLAAANEKRTPSSNAMGKRLFENTLLSPNFKNKVNTLVHQLTAQTTTHKTSSDISSVFTTRAAANQQTEPNGFTEATSTYRFNTNQNMKHEHQLVYRTKSDNRMDDNSKFSINASSLNNSKVKMDTENMKGRNTPSHPKPVIQVKLNLPKGDNGLAVCSPLSNPNRTARSKLDVKSPEAIDLQNRQVSYSDKIGHAHKYSENYMTNREDYRRLAKENSEVTTSLTNLYKGLDYHRKHVSKFGEELNPSNQPFFALNERKNDILRRDFTKDKENRLL